jgi:hypothetical protein
MELICGVRIAVIVCPTSGQDEPDDVVRVRRLECVDATGTDDVVRRAGDSAEVSHGLRVVSQRSKRRQLQGPCAAVAWTHGMAHLKTAS